MGGKKNIKGAVGGGQKTQGKDGVKGKGKGKGKEVDRDVISRPLDSSGSPTDFFARLNASKDVATRPIPYPPRSSVPKGPSQPQGKSNTQSQSQQSKGSQSSRQGRDATSSSQTHVKGGQGVAASSQSSSKTKTTGGPSQGSSSQRTPINGRRPPSKYSVESDDELIWLDTHGVVIASKGLFQQVQHGDIVGRVDRPRQSNHSRSMHAEDAFR